MDIQLKRRLAIFLISFLIINVLHAEEENFGKNTPSKEKIIEFFKEDSPKLRSINFIDENKSMLKHKTAKHALQKAASHALNEKAISMEILFDYNSATLTEEAKNQLRPVGSALTSNELAGFRYRIEGHTDIIGGDEFNIDLSRRRAMAVQEFLTQQSGLSPALTKIVGKGKNELADRNNPTSEVNRRVKIVRLGE
jgi:outer membrane protein OmpA-like peptidoglycan-associated protein